MVAENKRILLSSPHMSGNEQNYINNAFKENWIAPLGPNVNQFELDIAAYAGVKGASVTSSGTGAIHLALDILGVKQGDSVFCSTFTFVASANPALYLGADITFIDSEFETWNMSPFALERALSDAKKMGKLPKAIIVVNLYGQSAQMDELLEIANSYNVPIIEDAAESLGAEYKGKKSGTLGKIGIYSFNGNKIITTSGGGVLISDDEEIIGRSRFLATQARDEAPHYQHSVVGYNYRMSNILAGVGIAQLQVLDERVARRREIFDTYYQELAGIEGVQFMPELSGTKSNRWLTTLTIDQKIIQLSPYEIMDKMNEANIETRALWKPLHMQPLFKENKFYKDKNSLESTAGLLFANGLCLPSGSNMTDSDQARVLQKFKKIVLGE
ncbi:aminotransferase class I/II-fold pyridoxal phosphate-dependent enzyme [Carnobacterium maltaromaticum]|uniref:Aminotransferase class I/II-fold pyridoxal phosphate-dependent enzyme n=1 Tax=Carnobacterium maltaromaticum TaxID=2751 RepID=A0AAW9JQ98_CARML|nr:aminotransferase class I/II-fold pyridoxal phosphate-dependent enzyme [Carnobacterium maltaromaticum]MDZ5758632.1 aminotransferase class I/II-fold pyridoxal phosphate-dependent enzyme [Carnobacterium maltaromaticum]